MTSYIVGIDVSTDKKKRFFSLAEAHDSACTLLWIGSGEAQNEIVSRIEAILRKGDQVLLAIDAPLGWPAPLGKALSMHRAGEPIDVHPDDLFRRATDRFIKQMTGKQPLDVGADRIARTAIAALQLVQEIGAAIGKTIPLAWGPDFGSIGAIEVYPAATLKVCQIAHTNYKGSPGKELRKAMEAGLEEHSVIPKNLRKDLIADDNALDAAVCAVAGCDFLNDRCHIPVDLELAKREGWIWVRRS